MVLKDNIGEYNSSIKYKTFMEGTAKTIKIIEGRKIQNNSKS